MFTYFFSVVNFFSKIILLVSLWIQYNKATFQTNNGAVDNKLNSNPNQENLNSSGIAIAQMGSSYQK